MNHSRTCAGFSNLVDDCHGEVGDWDSRWLAVLAGQQIVATEPVLAGALARWQGDGRRDKRPFEGFFVSQLRQHVTGRRGTSFVLSRELGRIDQLQARRDQQALESSRLDAVDDGLSPADRMTA